VSCSLGFLFKLGRFISEETPPPPHVPQLVVWSTRRYRCSIFVTMKSHMFLTAVRHKQSSVYKTIGYGSSGKSASWHHCFVLYRPQIGSDFCHNFSITPFKKNYPLIIIIIFINCNRVITRWQWLFYMYTKYEIGY